mgnify:CR=1 FL=1
MDRKIETRQVHKDIKILDKTATVTDHIKQSYVRTKETVMQSTEKSSDRENDPVGYAEDAVSEYADRIFHETGHQVRRQAGKIIERKKEKASVSSTGEETVYQPKEEIRPVPPSGGETAQEQGKELAVKKIKTIERDKRTIKTGRASEQVVWGRQTFFSLLHISIPQVESQSGQSCRTACLPPFMQCFWFNQTLFKIKHTINMISGIFRNSHTIEK